MSQNLELPDPVFDALQQAAAASGTTPVGWIAAHLPKDEPPQKPLKEGAQTLADLFQGHLGKFASGKGNLSQDHSELFTEYLLQKRREGRL
jgi:hypothetical protein